MELTIFDFLFRLVPEGLIMVLAGYAISGKKIKIKKYLLSSLLIAGTIFIFRALPISSVLPMILTDIVGVIILVFINKIKPVHAILSTLICNILAVLAEATSLVILTKVFEIQAEDIFGSGVFMRFLYGLPSIASYSVLIVVAYFIMTSPKRRKS